MFAISQIASGCPKKALYLLALGVCVCSLSVLALGQQKRTSVAGRPLSLPAYTQEIAHWIRALETLKGHPENAAALREQLPSNWLVMVGAEHIEVSTDWLRRGLAAAEQDPNAAAEVAGRLLRHLQAMRQEAQELAATPPGIDGSAQAKLNAILAQSEFRGVHGPTWLDHLAERLRAWLAKWTRRLGMNLTGHPGIVNVVFWTLLVCGFGGLLVWMILQLLRRPGAQDSQQRAPETHLMDSRQQITQAREAAARGEYRDAIHLAYWAAIKRLEELGLWSLDPTRTHREYLRLVGYDQPQREPLAVLTRHFELAWYAAQPSTEDNFQTVMSQVEKLGCA